MFLKDKKSIIICLFLILYGLSFALTVQAGWLSEIGISGDSLIPEKCRKDGNCTLTDFVILAINLFRLMLGVLGSLALLFFIYGGIIFLLSRGSAEMIQRGKSILTQSLVGIMIVLGSWLIVNLVIAALTGTLDLSQPVKIFGTQPWSQLKTK
jgi:hypothetical protein